MRWCDQAEWITPARRTHEALVTDDLADAVPLRMQARRGPDLVCSRESSTPYALRGMLYCGACGRRMQGAPRVGKRATRILYRCELGKSRSVPAELTDHPPTVYLREDAVTLRLDEWIASLADPEDLAREQDRTWRPPLDTPLCSASSATPTARLPPSSRQWSLAWPSRTSPPHCEDTPPNATS
ncbi:zinc ribbon domain-containing protein [Mycobacterium sp.]|uniref:zinc ribbon domain-containing protein n=1 Tax=Mycobacterium sp. TaxID=1785 RepID=UPI002C704FE4|nr:zinc ribbon domain-containing protein [Mycobacterium sp.]HTY31279.1 zinc ribbon domain-containing protein [Mycobacterium sp.]